MKTLCLIPALCLTVLLAVPVSAAETTAPGTAPAPVVATETSPAPAISSEDAAAIAAVAANKPIFSSSTTATVAVVAILLLALYVVWGLVKRPDAAAPHSMADQRKSTVDGTHSSLGAN